ncbi:MAG TPA: hypothetical protein VF678_00945 [bacterium]
MARDKSLGIHSLPPSNGSLAPLLPDPAAILSEAASGGLSLERRRQLLIMAKERLPALEMEVEFWRLVLVRLDAMHAAETRPDPAPPRKRTAH